MWYRPRHTWDAAGNQTSRATDVGLSELVWDVEGELVSVTGGDGDVRNVYDADGNRLVRTDDAGVTVYLPGGQELHATEGGTVSATRWYTFAGTTVAVRTGKGLAGVRSVVTNHQGTPVAHVANTDRAAGVTRTYTDPHGNGSGTGPAITAGRGFLAAPVDATGLVQIGARYYDPVAGTFISVDPLLDPTLPAQFNAYVYSGNNPVTWSDPTGLVWKMDESHTNGGYRLDSAVQKVPVKPSSGPTAPRPPVTLPPIREGVPIEETRAYKQAMEDYAGRRGGIQGFVEGILLTVAGIGAVKSAGAKPPTNQRKPATSPPGQTASQIANGHAWDKHVIRKGEFPEVSTKQEFAALIDDVMITGEPRILSNGRSAYWKDGTVVIRDPGNPDGGTAFRPKDGYDYFTGESGLLK